MKLKNITLLILITGLIIVSSCAKKKHGLIVGSWEKVPLHESDIGHIEIWTFDASNKLTFSYDSVNYEAIYKPITKSFKAYVETLGLDSIYTYKMDGLYRINKVNEEILILHSDDPYIHKEFTRVK